MSNPKSMKWITGIIGELPIGPYQYETVRAMNSAHEGSGHVYILDKDGRKIASMWGKPHEKMALAQLIIDASIVACASPKETK